MEAWTLILWMMAHSNAASTVPFVAGQYSTKERCEAAVMAWRTADRDTFRSTGYRCIPTEKR